MKALLAPSILFGGVLGLLLGSAGDPLPPGTVVISSLPLPPAIKPLQPVGLGEAVTERCICPEQDGDEPDFAQTVQLTSDTANRLVGINFTCSHGASVSAFTGGRLRPINGDDKSNTTSSETGFNAALFYTGYQGVSAGSISGPQVSDIVSGLTLFASSDCSNGSTPKGMTASVTGGSNVGLFNPPARAYNQCVTFGQRFVGFEYSSSTYFNELRLAYYAF